MQMYGIGILVAVSRLNQAETEDNVPRGEPFSRLQPGFTQMRLAEILLGHGCTSGALADERLTSRMKNSCTFVYKDAPDRCSRRVRFWPSDAFNRAPTVVFRN